MNQYPRINGNPLTYDVNGNLTAMQNTATPISPVTASYDAQNRLLSATRGSGGGAATMEVVYDPWNRPIYRTVNGEKLFYAWDGWDLVGERTEAQYQVGEFERVYVHGAGVDEVLTIQQGYGGARKFAHHDALGSAIALTDASGSLLESYVYDVFGRPAVFDAVGQPLTSSAHGNRFLYTGREWISELSLYDYRNRVYSAEIGRFLQTDPIRFHAGDVNLYRYLFNMSAAGRDPFGLSFWSSFGQGLVHGLVSSAAVVATAAAVVAVAPAAAAAVTGALFVAGAVGGAAALGSLIANPSANNVGYTLGAFAGGSLIGGFAGRGLAARLSPSGHQPKGWSLGRDREQMWRRDPNLSLVGNWNKAMGTGPNSGGAAGAVGAAGAGMARGYSYAYRYDLYVDSDGDGEDDYSDNDDDNDGIDDKEDPDDDNDGVPDEKDPGHPACPIKL